jgi:hypothetical protein
LFSLLVVKAWVPESLSTFFNDLVHYDTKLLCFLLQPLTFALVYVGTTLKDLSDVTHGWNEFSTIRWVSAIASFMFVSLGNEGSGLST